MRNQDAARLANIMITCMKRDLIIDSTESLPVTTDPVHRRSHISKWGGSKVAQQQALSGFLIATALVAAKPGFAQQAQSPVEGPPQLQPIVITGSPVTADQQLQQEGTTAVGYRPQTASSVGALGSMKLLDTPYSLSVMPLDLIENVQAPSPDALLNINPLVQVTSPESAILTTCLQSRGFTVDTAIDGMRHLTFNFGPIPIEDKERIEVLSGLGGFL